MHRESISPMPIMNASNEVHSFSEIQVEDQPDLSQCRFLNSNASPGRTDLLSLGKTDLPTTERKRRLDKRFIVGATSD